MKVLWCSLVCLIATSLALSFETSNSVCNSRYLDPSIGKLFVDLLPTDVENEKFNSFLADANSNKMFTWTDPYGILMNTLSFRLPILNYISNGYFRVEYEKPIETFSFNDIYVIQENYASINTICNTFGRVFSSFAPLCKCWHGVPFEENSYQHFAQKSVEQYHHPAQWCMSKPQCTDKSLDNGYCTVTVDALRTSCVLIYRREQKDGLHHKVATSDLVTYTRKVPTLDTVWTSIISNIPILKTLKSGDQNIASIWTQIDENITKILSFLPTHLVLFILGLYITLNARDLAEDETFQYLMIALYGLLLAFVFLAYGMYRTSEQLMKRYGGPLPTFIHIPVLMSMSGYLFTNPYLPGIIFNGLVAFWESGTPFGIWWLGKAYFAFSMGASFYLAWFFALFKPETKSWLVMHYSVKLMGQILLAYSTTSTELSLLLSLLAMFAENITHIAWTVYLMSVTTMQKPSYKYLNSGKRLSQEELAVISAQHTQKHLNKLKQHLRSNPNVLNIMSDRFAEGGKEAQVKLINRFAEGSYPGVPYTQSEDSESTQKRGYFWVYIVLIAVFVYVLMNWQVKVESGTVDDM